MPSPYQHIVCVICGVIHATRSKTSRTCSKTCAARLRETEHPSAGRPPVTYPPSLVERVLDLYASGRTVAEIQQEIGPGAKAQRVLERHLDARRPAIPRDQTGTANPQWRGAEAGYAALHLRVQSERGKPQLCEWCGRTDGRMEWANVSGDYVDVADYARLCVSCHRTYDAARRRLTGRRTMPAEEVMSNV